MFESVLSVRLHLGCTTLTMSTTQSFAGMAGCIGMTMMFGPVRSRRLRFRRLTQRPNLSPKLMFCLLGLLAHIVPCTVLKKLLQVSVNLEGQSCVSAKDCRVKRRLHYYLVSRRQRRRILTLSCWSGRGCIQV